MKRLKPVGAYVRGLLGLKQIRTIYFAFLFFVFSTNLFATDPNIPSNATSASCNNATLETYSGTSNLQANWEANQIDLFWYSDDEQITNIQSAATTCDYDSGLTVPSNPPTKTGYTFNGWTVRGLPDGYTRLQYIQSSGTQYIDTQYTGNQNTEIIAKSLATTTGRYIYGVATSSNTRAITAYISSSGNWRMSSSATAVSNSTAYTLNKIHNTKHNKNGVWVDGVQIGSYTSITNFTTPNYLVIFGVNTGTPTGQSGIRIYSLSIKENNVLKRNFIPAKNSSNVLGMFDTVSGTFFTNAGTGTFTAGPVVQ